jgi:hypothetical protein
VIARLDDASDRLSPILVKEVRQIVRGREFAYSFHGSLLIALVVAAFGAADAVDGEGTTGWWVFTILTVGLGILGMVVVPIGAFSALRNERLEQTIDLITVTRMTPRQVIIGKLLAQAVKLATLFAGMAPFVATSFLLGGVDFVTIIVALTLVFLASLWACAVALFLSSLAKTRAMSGMLLIGFGLLLLGWLGGGQLVFMIAMAVSGGRSGRGPFGVGLGIGSIGASEAWWFLGSVTIFGLASLMNLVLLAENRLSSPVEDKATALRIGFFTQLAVMAGAFIAVWKFGTGTPSVAEPLVTLCGIHLAAVATFVVTEDLFVSRRVLLQMSRHRWWRWFDVVLRPGGGRGALYILMQMVLLFLLIAWVDATQRSLVVAMCGYICFMTGVPTLVHRIFRPRISSFRLRVAILLMLSASLILPDVLYFALWRPDIFELGYSTRHLVNPFRTLVNWNVIESRQWWTVPALLGSMGLTSYLVLVWMGVRASSEQTRSQRAPAAADAGSVVAY